MPNSDQKTIAIIDDDAEMRSLLHDFLTRRGYHVVCYESATLALQALLQGQPRLIDQPLLVISDIHMPEMDGREFLTHLKQASPLIPVILITAFGSSISRKQGLQSGATDLLVKPFTLAEIETAIRKAI